MVAAVSCLIGVSVLESEMTVVNSEFSLNCLCIISLYFCVKSEITQNCHTIHALGKHAELEGYGRTIRLAGR